MAGFIDKCQTCAVSEEGDNDFRELVHQRRTMFILPHAKDEVLAGLGSLIPQVLRLIGMQSNGSGCAEKGYKVKEKLFKRMEKIMV